MAKNEVPGRDADERPVAQTRRERDDPVLWLVIGFCLLVPVGLCIHWAASDHLYPPMLIAVLLGIGVAALTYRYLGATGGSAFSVGLLKVAGSAALLLGTAWFTNSELAKQMSKDTLPNKISELKARIAGDATKIEALEQEITRLKSDEEKEDLENEASVVQRVSNLEPDSPAVQKILELIEKKSGPFSEVKKKLVARVTFTPNPRDKGRFFACKSMALTGERVRVSRRPETGQDENYAEVDAMEAGGIASGPCDAPDRKFDLQMSCEAGLALLPEEIVGCSRDGNVNWKTPKGARVVRVSLEVLARK